VDHTQLSQRLVEIGREFYARGWVFGTSGNFSAVTQFDPLRLAITASGLDKGALTADRILEIDAGQQVLSGEGKPSAETRIHLAVIEHTGAGAVLHTHSVWGNLLSDLHRVDGAIPLSEQEMLKGLSGVTTHEHEERLPILDNTQDYEALSAQVADAIDEHPGCHGVMLRRHGLYTWGRDLEEARRHVEILEYLFEVSVRARQLRIQG
jgi:methylthioribulose-1-phosphate dehydratase